MNPLFLLIGMMGIAGGMGGGGSTPTPTSSGGDRPTPPVEDETPPVVVDDTPPPVAETPPPVEETPPPVDEPTPPKDEDTTPPDVVVDETDGKDGDDTGGGVVDPTPDAPDQPGDSDAGGETAPVIVTDTIDVMAGRVTTLAADGDDIVNVQLVSGVKHGQITVNEDNTLSLVMTRSDFTGSQNFSYKTIHDDGSEVTHKVTLDITEGPQGGGWATGESHYMLEVDENDRIVVETGDNHTKVYVSNSADALSLADIAEAEGLNVSDITGNWLANHGEYGQSEDLALDGDAGAMMWKSVSPMWSTHSNHLLLERGYQYDEFTQIILQGNHGESELEPIYVGAWGEGDKPDITNFQRIFQTPSDNIVFQDIMFSAGFQNLGSENIIFDAVSFRESSVGMQDGAGITIRNSDFLDITRDNPAGGYDEWLPHLNRTTGLYAQNNDGLLLEGIFVDHVGWEDDWRETGGQPPSMYSHNIYIDDANLDVTFRDNISMQASSYGAHVRSGGFIEDNALIDNNTGLSTFGGAFYGDEHSGNYALFSGNLITSAGHKVAEQIGAISGAIWDRSYLPSYVDNIIAHLADPNNPDEIAAKQVLNNPLDVSGDPYYADTIIHNWGTPADGTPHDQNTDGLDRDVLDQTTIQNFTAALLGKETATIEDLAAYLRAQSDGVFDDVVDADLILEFFREGFGLEADIRGDAETLIFQPDDIGDGVRWDNRMNWSTDDLPGTQDGDSVDLNGNEVVFGGTSEVDGLDFGNDGALIFDHGKLTVNDAMDAGWRGAHVEIDGAGQLWAAGYEGRGELDIDMAGGRLVNTGHMTNTDLSVSDGEAILATDGAEFELSASKTLSIFNAAAEVGFDGEDGGIALLDLEEGSTLAFGGEKLGTIEEFRSGAMGDAPDVQSGINLGGATLEIDLNNLSTSVGDTLTLMDSDELIGLFDEATSSIGGLGARDAKIVIDYEADVVRLELSDGTGDVSFETFGAESDVSDGNDALWDALTAEIGVASDELPNPLEDPDLVDAA